jgi:hypothetical protein
MKTWHAIALISACFVAVLAGMAQPGVPSGDFILLAQQRVPPLTGAVSPTNPFRREPLWVRLEDVASVRPMPSTGPHAGHTSLTIGHERSYTVIVWGTPENFVKAWGTRLRRVVVSVE